MPTAATITAFYTFSPGTKAKSTQVNVNFSNFRGHLVPIEPLTVTSSDLVYDVGSSEHRWRAGYFGRIATTLNMTSSASHTGSFDTQSTTPVDITSLSLAFTTQGGPVEISLFGGVSAASNSFVATSLSGVTTTGFVTAYTYIQCVRDTTTSLVDDGPIAMNVIRTDGDFSYAIPPSSFRWIDNPGPGTYTYRIQAFTNNAAMTASLHNVRMRARIVLGG